MNFKERLKSAREKRGMTLAELGERINKTEATVQRYESGNIKNLKNDTIEAIANALKVNPAYLMGWSDIVENFKTRKIPVLGTITCGDPILAEENIEEFREALDDNLPSGNLFYLKTKGTSMTPTIPENSYVLIKQQPDVEDGEIAAVLVNGNTEATLKRIKRQGNIVMLMPDNPEHSPFIVTADNPAQILGKAIKFSADL